jgi:hypothetical protein
MTFLFLELLTQLPSNQSENYRYLKLTCLQKIRNKIKIHFYIFLLVIVE